MEKEVKHDDIGSYIKYQTSFDLNKKYELVDKANHYIFIRSKSFQSKEPNRYGIYSYNHMSGFEKIYRGDSKAKFKILLNLLGKRTAVFVIKTNKLKRGSRFEAYLTTIS